ncbi:hypothetical protein Hamer_G020034 [Homarus americanus]|uniref:Uncharacterized protein n=1 Tax=Homarus americanus TaxID=6706 RepID=A0A8J5N5K7_HOMAM|nr:hypothetical protein Hamer_G020034 [Homarus americanus]
MAIIRAGVGHMESSSVGRSNRTPHPDQSTTASLLSYHLPAHMLTSNNRERCEDDNGGATDTGPTTDNTSRSRRPPYQEPGVHPSDRRVNDAAGDRSRPPVLFI